MPPAARSSATRRRAPVLDPVTAGAVDLARSAVEEDAPVGAVGEHLGVGVEGERLVSHRFACLLPGYAGWVWTAVLARVPRAKVATVCEVALLPGEGALLAPAWVPWEQRVRPGDLGAGDALPYREDDPRLEPGYAATGEPDEDAVALWELGLGRARVLSVEGRAEAAERWYSGDHGPRAETALQASAPCSTCGFFVPVSGSLRRLFGVCANSWSPDDGRVVSVDHGCGAHSETDVEAPRAEPLPPPVLDELGFEPV